MRRVFLEQVFFGRGPQGYAILGATPGGISFRGAVESLCESIGAPFAVFSFQPFLIAKPFRESVVMVRASRGERDSTGRDTVFFHALIGNAEELAAAHLDAFVLDERGAFVDRLPRHFERMEFSAEAASPEGSRPRFKIDCPAAIVSSRPENDLIRSLLGSDTLARAWSTFAFRAVPGLDLYALDVRAACPDDVACYNVDGRLVSEPALDGSCRGEALDGGAVDSGRRRIVLKISLAINVLLILAGVLLLSTGSPSASVANPAGDALRKDEPLSAEVERFRISDGNLVSREEHLRELRDRFEAPPYNGKRREAMGANFSPENRRAFNPYVNFVNDVILTSTDEE